MESINPNKFSRHLVIWLPNAAFQSGPELGKFVKDAVLQHEAACSLQVKSGQSMIPIVDTSVYSRCVPCDWLAHSQFPHMHTCKALIITSRFSVQEQVFQMLVQ
jgi:hypothetical protein